MATDDNDAVAGWLRMTAIWMHEMHISHLFKCIKCGTTFYSHSFLKHILIPRRGGGRARTWLQMLEEEVENASITVSKRLTSIIPPNRCISKHHPQRLPRLLAPSSREITS